MYGCMYVCMYVYMYVYLYICMCVYVCRYICSRFEESFLAYVMHIFRRAHWQIYVVRGLKSPKDWAMISFWKHLIWGSGQKCHRTETTSDVVTLHAYIYIYIIEYINNNDNNDDSSCNDNKNSSDTNEKWESHIFTE